MTDNGDGGWWFHSDDFSMLGIRLTHQPSPWMGDWGQIRFAGSITDPSHSDSNQVSSYDPRASTWKPYLFNATLASFGGPTAATTVEVTPSEHGAIMRWTFPPYTTSSPDEGWNQTRRIAIILNSGGDVATIGTDSSSFANVSGYTTASSGGVPNGYKHYFYATISGGPVGDIPITPMWTSTATSNGVRWACLDFDPSVAASQVITLRLATSLISPAQAMTTHAAEVEGNTFEVIMAAAKAAWHTTLSRVSLNDLGTGYTPEQADGVYEVFYSCLWRASRYPRKLWEIDNTGAAVHWSAYDGKVYPGYAATDSGAWDGYRTTYPLLALTQPAEYSWMVNGFLNAYNEYGWLPQWYVL